LSSLSLATAFKWLVSAHAGHTGSELTREGPVQHRKKGRLDLYLREHAHHRGPASKSTPKNAKVYFKVSFLWASSRKTWFVITDNQSAFWNKKCAPKDAFSVELNLQFRLVPSSSLLVFLVIIVVLEGWLHAWLRRVLGIGRDFFTVVLFLLLNFFVVGDITWVGHENSLSGQRVQTPTDAIRWL
jgi:hypothetical protein